jgi:large subunit ribosomal protein L24
MKRLRTGDDVIVIAGKDTGKRGTISRIMPYDRVVIDNVNIVKRHTKANPNQGVAGGIVEKEMPIHSSNVALFNPATKKAGKVGIKVLKDGRKVRYFKSNNEVLDK